jgi:predicted acylesterase/phospholipase RssA
VTDTVIQLLRDRKQEESSPGHRRDDARLVLLIRGVSSRDAYSSGMTIAIEQMGLLPMFDAVYGSSAGALNAAWLLCGRAESTQHAWWNPTVMRRPLDGSGTGRDADA